MRPTRPTDALMVAAGSRPHGIRGANRHSLRGSTFQVRPARPTGALMVAAGSGFHSIGGANRDSLRGSTFQVRPAWSPDALMVTAGSRSHCIRGVNRHLLRGSTFKVRPRRRPGGIAMTWGSFARLRLAQDDRGSEAVGLTQSADPIVILKSGATSAATKDPLFIERAVGRRGTCRRLVRIALTSDRQEPGGTLRRRLISRRRPRGPSVSRRCPPPPATLPPTS